MCKVKIWRYIRSLTLFLLLPFPPLVALLSWQPALHIYLMLWKLLDTVTANYFGTSHTIFREYVRVSHKVTLQTCMHINWGWAIQREVQGSIAASRRQKLQKWNTHAWVLGCSLCWESVCLSLPMLLHKQVRPW